MQSKLKFNLSGAILGVVILLIVSMIGLAFYGLSFLLEAEIRGIVLYIFGSMLVASFIFGGSIFTKN